MQEYYTQEDISTIAKKILSQLTPKSDKATVVGLSGDLGAGKTTLVKAIAPLLGISETVQSPTFVVAKRYTTSDKTFVSLIHIDAYRIESDEELLPLHFNEMLKEKKTLIIIEWPERVKQSLPADVSLFLLEHSNEGRRIQTI